MGGVERGFDCGVDFLCGRGMIGGRFGAEGVISSLSFHF